MKNTILFFGCFQLVIMFSLIPALASWLVYSGHYWSMILVLPYGYGVINFTGITFDAAMCD